MYIIKNIPDEEHHELLGGHGSTVENHRYGVKFCVENLYEKTIDDTNDSTAVKRPFRRVRDLTSSTR